MTEHARSRTASASLAAAAATLSLADKAEATTFNESADFGNSFSESTSLPLGTDVVNGSMFPGEGDSSDFITFHSLEPDASFFLTTTNTGNDIDNFFNICRHADDGSSVQCDFGTDAQLSGTIPASGFLHFGMFVEGSGLSYELTLSAPLAPEPTTAALLGGGLLAAAALRRVRAARGS